MKGLLSHILVVLNGSESCIAAAKYAIAMKKSFGCRVTAVYVVDTATIRQLAGSRIFVAEESEEYERSLADTGRRYLGFVEELAREKDLSIESHLLKGPIAHEVVRAAEDAGVDCILVGGVEHDSSFRDIIQDANREIARLARCSVLFVKCSAAEAVYRAS